MLAVGIFYVVLGVRLLPWINGPMIEAFGDFATPGVNVDAASPLFTLLIDWMATFGLDLLVIGVVLVIAARNAYDHRILVYVVLAQEATRGILADLWFASRSFNSAGFYLGFLGVHAVVIVTGLRALQRADPEPASVRT